MEKLEWTTEKRKVNDLVPYEHNPRQINEKQVSVLDVFGGSGSTLMACEQLNRNCYMMELEPKYIDVIIKRWEQFTGEKAIKL